jgi:hypothetical protein
MGNSWKGKDDFHELQSLKNVKMLVNGEASMGLVPEVTPVPTLSELKEDPSSLSPISHPSLCVDHIPLPGKYRDGSSSPTPLYSVKTPETLLSCNPPPVYDSSLLSPGHCSPPPAYTPLYKEEDPTLRPSACSCGESRKVKRRRLVAVLTVIIMILLSITVGVAIKHWELLSEVGEEAGEFGEEAEEVGEEAEEVGEEAGEVGEEAEEVGEEAEEVGEIIEDNFDIDYATNVSVINLASENVNLHL